MMRSRKLIMWVGLFLLGLKVPAKVVVVTDIDDTIKKANSEGRFGKAWHFVRKKVYFEMRDLFVQLEEHYQQGGQEVEFRYVSAAYDFMFRQQKWLRKHGFPKGITRLRHFGDGNIENFKYRVIRKIVEESLANSSEEVTFFFFGDNSDKDHTVYAQISHELALERAHIYIRDVSTEYTYLAPYLEVESLSGVNFFFSERDFVDDEVLAFLSPKWRANVLEKFEKQQLIPDYTLKTLQRRIKSDHCKVIPVSGRRKRCKNNSDEMGEKVWHNYHKNYPLRPFSESSESLASALAIPY